jgi:diketogulonate reductase-like aldo/keto reductase
MKNRTLRNGVTIPEIGFGTWQTPDGQTAVDSVLAAIRSGYRHIDGAAVYGNEKSVGQGIAEAIQSGLVTRKDLFLTSKLWNTERGYDKTMKAFEKTLSDLGTDYLDLYLIHWPANAHQFSNWEEINLSTWKAMTELYKAGKIRAIGVSNFEPQHLKALMETEVAPMVDQIEFHPGTMQARTVQFCHDNGILVEAWSPLGTGRMLKNETLLEVASHYGKSTAQICIRWALQHDIVPLPKSTHENRIRENLDVFDFEISEEDMRTIDSLPDFGGSGLHPDEVDF